MIGGFGAGINQTSMLTDFIERTDVDILMCAGRLTLLEHASAERMLDAATRHNVGIVAAAVYNSGLLSRESVPDDATFDYAQAPAELIARARVVEAVCRRHGVSLPAAALQFGFRYPQVVSVVAGFRGAEQAAQTAERMAAPIPAEFWAELEAEGLITPRRTA